VLLGCHGQGNHRDAEGELDTMSVLWPTNEGVDPGVVDASKRAVAAIVGSLEEYDDDQLTRYPGADNPAIGAQRLRARRHAGGAGGTALLAGDVRALPRARPRLQRAGVALALEGFITMRGVVEAFADGSIDSLDPAVADAIPARSPGISYAELYTDDSYVPNDAVFA
jgi:hypothetical protein